MTQANNIHTDCTTLDELIDIEYGEKGAPTRDLFDAETQEFMIAQMVRL